MFAFRDRRDRVEVAFTDRYGEVDGAHGDALDLAEPPVADLADGADHASLAVARQRLEHDLARIAAALADDVVDGAEPVRPGRVVRMRQVHGADVHTVDRAWLAQPDPDPPLVDGLVTDVPGVTLLVRVADCVPLLLADVERGVVGAAHAGRQGLVAGIVPATVARMRALGAERIVAWMGPHVCGHCYEVPATMRAEVAAAVPASFAETTWGTPAVDVGAGVAAQLAADGVDLVDASRCTVEDDDLYSYRRQGGESGRLGGLIRVRP
ncbi:MAG: polyphenol oxidase family protein [Brachybacterium paraconglomeratum]|nr:polyphenol oxidase family protein [Brachybacterium paraconglomeratum]